MRIVFIRHFKTKGNLEKRYVGRTDEDILDCEIDKAYPKTQIVFVSHYKRCLQTAIKIYPDTEIIKIEKLNETDFGDFEYKNFYDLQNDKIYKLWLESEGKMGFPNGEAYEEFNTRTIDGFLEAVKYAKKRNLEDIAFVIHGGSIMAILSHFLNGNFYDYQASNGCGYLTEYKENKLEILGEV